MSFIQQTFNLFKSFYPNVISQNSQVWSTHSCSLIKTVLMLTLVVSHAVSVPTSAPFIPNDIEKADNEPQSKNDINYAPLFMSRKLLQCSVTAPFPGHSSTYSGNVRGYYFQAPTNFAITSIFIPTDASTGSSTAAVVRFNSVAPPEYSATTNDFTQLGYWVQSAASTISTNCICVSSGQYIGIIGYRGTSNSYGNAPYTSSINGYSVVFRRMGMQNSLITSAPHNLFGQADGDSLSRVHFTYTICDSTCNCPGLTSAPTSIVSTSAAPTSAPIVPTECPLVSATSSLPPHSSSYTGNIRGYYFQAPVHFAFTGISVPTSASLSSTTAAIVRFNSGAPPDWTSTTNDFVQLGYWKQSSLSTIPVNCICVSAGDWIGILGYRGTTNSYGSTPYATTIASQPVTFTRMAMQFSLVTYAPKDIYGRGGTSLSRVQFTYTTCHLTCPCPELTVEPSIPPA
eukprot:74692_1